ncbi:MAG: hypothetical protein AB2A00_11555 [Myxococcota bacterium]
MRQLVERYAALCGGALRELGPDCVEVDIPPPDRPAFNGKARVLIAFTVQALQSHPEASVLVVGSALLEQFISAIRSRGTRWDLGDVPATMPTDAESARLELPVLNGQAATPEVRLARHPAGRLVARVEVRAGASLHTYLQESGVFDLSTAALLPEDVAAACLQQGNPVGTDGMPRIGARQVQEIVSLMLRDLEQRLAPDLDGQRAAAAKSLQVELARLDTYYRTILQDSAERSEEARRTVESEQRRRREEEVRRHQVKAVVHPVQMSACTIPVQRAEWRVTSKDGHSAVVVATRALVGSGKWSVGCAHCGHSQPRALLVCRHDHAACGACGTLCSVCATGCCRTHGAVTCHVDGMASCDVHARSCAACRKPHCSAHERLCEEEGHPVCAECVHACASCRRMVCDRHAVVTSAQAPLGSRRLCTRCVRYCEGGATEPVGRDETVRCASCERSVCTRHQALCAVDARVHCSRHLRRADRSRRLVCEHHVARCIHDPHAYFASDEVAACGSCGGLVCGDHSGTCTVDGKVHCVGHLVALREQDGGRACAAHHSVCHVDEMTFSLAGTRECPVCRRTTCDDHFASCRSCARSVCVADVPTGGSRTCKTCAAFEEVADPSDQLIAAATTALGERRKVNRWRAARDATHVVVDLDLGWTRRVVFTVRHGDDQPETVVKHSMFGQTRMRG